MRQRWDIPERDSSSLIPDWDWLSSWQSGMLSPLVAALEEDGWYDVAELLTDIVRLAELPQVASSYPATSRLIQICARWVGLTSTYDAEEIAAQLHDQAVSFVIAFRAVGLVSTLIGDEEIRLAEELGESLTPMMDDDSRSSVIDALDTAVSASDLARLSRALRAHTNSGTESATVIVALLHDVPTSWASSYTGDSR